MTEREKALERQCKDLADRLALALAVFADYEIDFDLERHSRDERNEWRELQYMILSDHNIWRAERKKRRKWVFYELSMQRIRKWMRRNIERERKAA